MPVKHDCHGGVHSPAMALYHAAHEYGLKPLAAELGTSADVLRKKLCPNTTSHIPQFREAISILETTNDDRILDAICAQVGAVWFRPEMVDAAPSDMGILKISMELMNNAMAVITELEDSLDDGNITPDERAKLDKALLDLAKGAKVVDLTAQKFEGINHG